MCEGATTRYEIRVREIVFQFARTPRQVHHISWAQYAEILTHPDADEFGRLDAIEMYESLLMANGN